MSLHKKISFYKSAVRLVGYILGMAAFWNNTLAFVAFAVLFISEVIGVVEELGEK